MAVETAPFKFLKSADWAPGPISSVKASLFESFTKAGTHSLYAQNQAALLSWDPVNGHVEDGTRVAESSLTSGDRICYIPVKLSTHRTDLTVAMRSTGIVCSVWVWNEGKTVSVEGHMHSNTGGESLDTMSLDVTSLYTAPGPATIWLEVRLARYAGSDAGQDGLLSMFRILEDEIAAADLPFRHYGT